LGSPQEPGPRMSLYDPEVANACLKLFTEKMYLVQKRGRFSLRELSDLLAPAAQTKGLTEEEMMRHVKEARRRIWQERYREMVVRLRPARKKRVTP